MAAQSSWAAGMRIRSPSIFLESKDTARSTGQEYGYWRSVIPILQLSSLIYLSCVEGSTLAILNF